MSDDVIDLPSQPSADFIFGATATDQQRLARLRADGLWLSHANRLTPPDPRPGEAVTVHVSSGPRCAAEHMTCYYTTDGSDPAGHLGVAQHGHAVQLMPASIAWDTILWGYVTHWAGVIPGQPAGILVRYRIEAWSPDGVSLDCHEIGWLVAGEPPEGVDPAVVALLTPPGGPPAWPARRLAGSAYHVDAEQAPEWLRDAVIYQIFVDRFAPSGGQPFVRPPSLSDVFGGTLQGITEQLGYLADLGVTCLWLTPIVPSPTHHRYDATDYFSVDPRLGTLDDLRVLIAAAHARGMRVVLDFVANHLHRSHPVFAAAQADRGAAEAAWFTFTSWPEQYLSFFGVQDMPQIDTDHPAAAEHLIQSARFWLAQGVDGFRLDYAIGPSHAFWSRFRAATRAVAPASVTFGEAVETPEVLRSYAGRMDGCLDFVLMEMLRQLFIFGGLTPSAFDAFLRQHLAFFPADFVLPSFLDNHDMNRFLWAAQGDQRRLRLAALCQFTLPHPPITYYGTEVGLSQESDVRAPGELGGLEQSRLPMRWGAAQDQALLAFYRRLIALRRAAPQLWRGARTTVLAEDARGLYGYRCAAAGEVAVVALNLSGAAQAVELPHAAGCALELGSADDIAWDGRVLRLPPLAGAILRSTS